MPVITMTFPHVNDSVQVGDTTYYQASGTTNITEMGTVQQQHLQLYQQI